MARARNIKPGFFCNDGLVELPFEVRLLFIGLWTLADREGRLEDRPKRIRMEIFPGDDVNVDQALGMLAKAGFIVRYEVEERRYIEVLNFAKHQNPHPREAASTIPARDGSIPARIERASQYIPVEVRATILARDGKCLKCGTTEALELDHIVPIASGGKTEASNLQTLCRSCNAAKGARSDSDHRDSDASIGSEFEPRTGKGEPRTDQGKPRTSFSGMSRALTSFPSESPSLNPESPSPSPLHDGSEMRASPSTSVLFAIEARKRGIACNGHDPRLASIAERGVGVEAFCAACDEARKGRESERITLALPLRILESWTEQASRITANGATAPPARAPTAAERAAANVASLTGRNRNPPPVTIDAESAAPTARLG